MLENKEYLRALAKKKMQELESNDVKIKSKQINDKFLESDIYAKANKIAFYLSFKNEVDLKIAINKSLEDNKFCYVPNMINDKLSFVEFNKESKLEKNKFGFYEVIDAREVVSIDSLDLILMPLLMFDKNKTRLGRGAGYYDKALELKNHNTLLAGIAYSMQETEKIPKDSWDVPLDYVITEQGII